MKSLFPSLLGGSAQRRGFTMIEILVVVVIIGILAFALIPRFAGYQARARDTARDVSLKQTASALELYANDNYGQYPDPYRGLGMKNSFVASLNRENFYASLGNPGLLSVYDIKDHLTNYLQVLPTDPGHGLSTDTSNGSCVQGGDYFAYVVNNSRHMFGIISHAESRKGNAENCTGRSFNTRDGRFSIVGVNLLTDDSEFVPGPGGPGQGSGGGNNNYGGGIGGGGGSQNICFDIEINDDTTSAKIINYNNGLSGCGNTVTIPTTLSGLSVTHIGSSAFTNKSINRVIISSLVQVIEPGAFRLNGSSANSYDLTGFVAGADQTWFLTERTWMREGATDDNNNLSPEERCFNFDNGTITRYHYLDDPETYGYCGTDIVIPETIGGVTVTTIGEKAFSKIPVSKSVFIESIFSDEDAGIIDQLFFDHQGGLNSIIIPNTVTRIEDMAFTAVGNGTLEWVEEDQEYIYTPNPISITLPSTLTYVGDIAFGAAGMGGVIDLSNTTSIGIGGFAANYLTDVTFSDSLASLPDLTFMKNDLTSIDLKNVISVGTMAFAANQITSINIQNMNDIQTFAFAMNQITTVELTNIGYIGQLAFAGNQINSIELNQIGTIDEVAFAMNNISTINLESVDNINVVAFAYNPMTKVTSKGDVQLIFYIEEDTGPYAPYYSYEAGTYNLKTTENGVPLEHGEWEWIIEGPQYDPMSILLEATTTVVNQTVTINKYFNVANYTIDRGDGTAGTISTSLTKTYTTAGTYTIELKNPGSRWLFSDQPNALVPKAGTTAPTIKVIAMPSLAEGFGPTNSHAGDNFFASFNMNGALSALATGSFDTSHLTSVGESFFNGFNFAGNLTALPEGSFRLNNISTVGNHFFIVFNLQGGLRSLPEGSFKRGNITDAKNGFFHNFNQQGWLGSLPEGSFDTSSITTVGGQFFRGFNRQSNSNALTHLPEGSFDTSNISGTVGSQFFGHFNSNSTSLKSLPEGSFQIPNITAHGSEFFHAFDFVNSITCRPIGAFVGPRESSINFTYMPTTYCAY